MRLRQEERFRKLRRYAAEERLHLLSRRQPQWCGTFGVGNHGRRSRRQCMLLWWIRSNRIHKVRQRRQLTCFLLLVSFPKTHRLKRFRDGPQSINLLAICKRSQHRVLICKVSHAESFQLNR